MRNLARISLPLLLFLFPLSTFAFPMQYSIPGLSSGGKLTAPSIPCIWAGIPALYVSLTSARATDPWVPEFYIWVLPPAPRTPVITRTDGFGPPVRPRQQFLGITGLPTVCFIPTIPPVPLFGLLMHAIGTGNPVSTSFF